MPPVGPSARAAAAVAAALCRNDIVPIATILTPNQFEAQLLSGVTISDMDTAWAAIDVLHARGPKTVIITSTDFAPAAERVMYMLVSCPWGAWTQRAMRVRMRPCDGELVRGTSAAACAVRTRALCLPRPGHRSQPCTTLQTVCRMRGIPCLRAWIALHVRTRGSW
ncbi:hypothetical protein EON67_05250 [archaeon]|nr:MAG: hypothetical protein EON67_05250 [archaeon]